MRGRRLKRQLNLLQVVMLGTVGTIGAEIFVLTGYAAGLVGPATVLVLIIGGLLSYSVALNYCELATTYPVTGGALTYVREAYGTNLLSFLVGCLDCFSSTFYCALSAVGFAYSLQVFVPFLPIVPTAITVVVLFTVLNVLGVSKVGNVQGVLGGILLAIFFMYISASFTHPAGFRWETFFAGGRFFIHQESWTNLARFLEAIALVYVSYVGFEVIADDAEEIQNPNRNIPRGILISLTLCILIYSILVLATLGALSWREIAGSATGLTDAARRFMPGWGAPLMAVAGLIATLTTINTTMLSATREAFTLSRDGLWPQPLARLGRFRTPYVTILFIGGVICLVTVIGLVDFLSYISSSGYLFVLFWASLAMVRLRKLHPEIVRPFRVPLFPLTPYLAAASCFLIVAFTQWRALLFGAGVIGVCSLYYLLYRPISRAVAARIKIHELGKDRILIPVANPRTAKKLVHLASILARASADTSICVLTVVPVSPHLPPEVASRLATYLGRRERTLLSQIAEEALAKDVPLYTKLRPAPSVSQGILNEIHSNVKLVLMGWPGPLEAQKAAENPVKAVLERAHPNIAVLLDRDLKQVRRILVPVGANSHSRLALRLAFEIAEVEKAQITVLGSFAETGDAEALEDQMLSLEAIVREEFGYLPPRILFRLIAAKDLFAGILSETHRLCYDLMVIGATRDLVAPAKLFGFLEDKIAEEVPCSVLLVHHHELAAISWLRRRVKV